MERCLFYEKEDGSAGYDLDPIVARRVSIEEDEGTKYVGKMMPLTCEGVPDPDRDWAIFGDQEPRRCVRFCRLHLSVMPHRGIGSYGGQ